MRAAYPRIGNRVAITFITNGKGEVEPTKRTAYQKIECIYSDGRVRTTSGDVWKVVKNSDFITYKARWVTVR